MNLKRRPDRLRQFFLNNAHIKQYVTIFEAIDGENIDLKSLALENLIVGPFKTMNKFIIANALSQRALWIHCMNMDENILIFEDDAILRYDFIQMYKNVVRQVPDFDILFFGYNFDSIIHFNILNDIQSMRVFFDHRIFDFNTFQNDETLVNAYRTINNFGVPGYVISPRGAKRLLELSFPLQENLTYVPALKGSVLTYTLDIIINSHYDKINPYVCFPPLVITPNDKDDSDCTGFDKIP